MLFVNEYVRAIINFFEIDIIVLVQNQRSLIGQIVVGSVKEYYLANKLFLVITHVQPGFHIMLIYKLS